MLKDPSVRYRSFTSVELPDRQWPARRLERPPVWVSTDLRDGNQALFEPMNMERKLRFFHALVAAGFKEIEVAFPASSEIEFAFVRKLIEEDLIPDDVTIEVMTQARERLIERTIESLAGAPRAIVHLYNATAPAFRRIVFDLDKQGVMDIAVRSTALIRELTQQRPDTEWSFQYSPETFSATELDFSKEICDAVAQTWGPTRERKMIVNLPATVEIGTPNHYADQIEWMHRNLANRDCLVLSVHPHNDRGTAVAAAELAVMAGAERVEGCLFGNGERTGNVDLVSLTLNFYSQGIHPGLDFSDIDEVARTVEYCNQLPVHPRHPYAGDLVFTAFSGSHQDAIKKGMQAQSPIGLWEVPYLPVDPADLGRTYDSIIRVNSQSGKGGISYLLEREHGLVMPRRLQVEFSSVVQAYCDAQGTEIDSGDLWRLFRQTYLESAEPIKYISHRLTEHREGQGIELVVERDGARRTLVGVGNGPIDAAVHALDLPIRVNSFEEHSAAPGASARAFAMLETGMAGQPGFRFGVGLHENTVTASIAATISAANRWLGNR